LRDLSFVPGPEPVDDTEYALLGVTEDIPPLV
jgi:hypothetical protein